MKKAMLVLVGLVLLGGFAQAGDLPTPQEVELWFYHNSARMGNPVLLDKSDCGVPSMMPVIAIGDNVQYMLDPDWDPWAATVTIVHAEGFAEGRVTIIAFPWNADFGGPVYIERVKFQDRPHQGGIWREIQ